jgi:hypothetical protein
MVAHDIQIRTGPFPVEHGSPLNPQPVHNGPVGSNYTPEHLKITGSQTVTNSCRHVSRTHCGVK